MLLILLLMLMAVAAPAAGQTHSAAAAAPRKLVVVDAGHGGVDPGAHGPSGVLEKDVALAVARRLAVLLRQEPDLEVRLTRDADTLIALRDRPRMANRWRDPEQPALFISIHCNASTSRNAVGYETYFLSDAKTEDARRVARMENEAERFETPVAAPGDPLSFILQDLRQNQHLRESSSWAADIQRRLRAVHPGPNRGVKQAGFTVLNGAFMPAVLVEIGFITNTAEEAMLADAKQQDRIARELAAAIRDYWSAPAARRAARGESSATRS